MRTLLLILIGTLLPLQAARAQWPDAGKFILTLRKRPDDRWRITPDVDNRNR